MKNIWKILLLNLSIAAAAVICYSDGLLALRVTDPNIIRAGLSILSGLGLGAGLVGGNVALLKAPGKPKVLALKSPDEAQTVLKEYFRSEYFGDLARAAYEQLGRLENSRGRASAAILTKFQQGSMSAHRYISAVDAAAETVRQNVVNIAIRMRIFDDDEFRRLKHYRDDDIPDDIQIRQIELYERNTELIKKAIAANEELLLKLDTLAMEVSDSTLHTGEEPDALLGEISRLTDELKYYGD